jgi:hypothetical protein
MLNLYIKRTAGYLLILFISYLFFHFNFLKSRWDYIIIHHSATKFGSVQIFRAGHYARGGAWPFNDTMLYHIVIGNGIGTGDGELQEGGRWLCQQLGGGCRSVVYNFHPKNIRDFFRTWSDYYNFKGIHICLVGDLSTTHPTPKQMATLTAVVDTLCRRYHIPPRCVLGHKDAQITTTECPGTNFPLNQFRAGIEDQLRREPKVKLEKLFTWKIRVMNFWPLLGFFFGEIYFAGFLLILDIGLIFLFVRIALPLAQIRRMEIKETPAIEEKLEKSEKIDRINP